MTSLWPFECKCVNDFYKMIMLICWYYEILKLHNILFLMHTIFCYNMYNYFNYLKTPDKYYFIQMAVINFCISFFLDISNKSTDTVLKWTFTIRWLCWYIGITKSVLEMHNILFLMHMLFFVIANYYEFFKNIR